MKIVGQQWRLCALFYIENDYSAELFGTSRRIYDAKVK